MGDDSVEGAGFWLPSEFFTDDDFLMDKQNFTKNNSNPESASKVCFPTELPYSFKSESDEYVDNFWVMSTSPQSTLAHMGSSNGAPSPPTIQLCAENTDVQDLIQRAAGQVAMLKLSAGGDRFGPGPTKDTRSVGAPRSFAQHAKNITPSVYHHAQGCGVVYGQRQMYQNKDQSARTTIQQNPNRVGSGRWAVVMGGPGGGGALKSECAGTGVFLPRRYDDNTSDTPKRPGGGGSTTLYPNGAATHALNKRSDNIAGIGQSQSLSRPPFIGGFVQDYVFADLLMARRHALMLRQQRSLLLAERSSMISREMYLPQEWTY